MYSTAQTSVERERNLAGGIAPQTGVKITSQSAFSDDTIVLRWETGGDVVDQFKVAVGTVQGGFDLYQSDVLVYFRITNSYTGVRVISGVPATSAWIRLFYRYGGGEFKYIDQLVSLTVTAPIISTDWDDNGVWDDNEDWTE
ncbi:hypothetical protein [uncultured Paraglaciecola sp.]|uniref:hypothetical protein n=1 Tax=uncultured Paraglaciecola sp. TaxID=1765024 RepID=UPI002608269F|nr:hypothetical protein [uncultured Paraglaciecola sp.]